MSANNKGQNVANAPLLRKNVVNVIYSYVKLSSKVE